MVGQAKPSPDTKAELEKRHCSCLGRVGTAQDTGRCFGRSRSCQIGSRERTQDTNLPPNQEGQRDKSLTDSAVVT